jgi:hypothetical protein
MVTWPPSFMSRMSPISAGGREFCDALLRTDDSGVIECNRISDWKI